MHKMGTGSSGGSLVSVRWLIALGVAVGATLGACDDHDEDEGEEQPAQVCEGDEPKVALCKVQVCEPCEKEDEEQGFLSGGHGGHDHDHDHDDDGDHDHDHDHDHDDDGDDDHDDGDCPHDDGDDDGEDDGGGDDDGECEPCEEGTEVLNVCPDQVAHYLEEGYVQGGAWYVDADGDGFGDENTVAASCGGPGLVEVGGDCDDGDAGVYAGAAEVCGNGVDESCDGAVDEGCGSPVAAMNPWNGIEHTGQDIRFYPLGQTLVLGKGGHIIGAEFLLWQYGGSPVEVKLSVFDAEDNLIASATISSELLPASIDDDFAQTVGPGYFDLTADGAEVKAGQQIKLMLEQPGCDLQTNRCKAAPMLVCFYDYECNEEIVIQQGQDYSEGYAFQEVSEIEIEELDFAFRVFTE